MAYNGELEAGMVFQYAGDKSEVDQHWMQIKEIVDEDTIVLMFEDENDTSRAPNKSFSELFPNWELMANRDVEEKPESHLPSNYQHQ